MSVRPSDSRLVDSDADDRIDSTVDSPDDPQAAIDVVCGFATDSFACRKYHLDHPVED
jgi:hypothetical protein